MTFDPTIPQATDLLSDSQSDLLTNFNQSNIIMGVNHVNFDNSLPIGSLVANRGKHTFVSLIEQVANPVTAANEIALFSKDLGGISTLFMRKESNGAVIQMSGIDPNNSQTFLPGGLILKWGLNAVATDGSTVIAFPVAFPTACLAVMATVVTTTVNSARYVSVFNVGPAQFNAVTNVAQNIYWFAIGN